MKGRYRSLYPLIQWQAVGRPIDWGQAFGRQQPLAFEIGCGNGEYLLEYAREHPNQNIVAIDQAWTAVLRVLRRIAAGGPPNIRVLYGDTRVVLQRCFRPESLAHAYALFPCPWPKTPHLRHRLFAAPFLRLLNSRLMPGAQARIVTDSSAYRNWIAEQHLDTGFRLEDAALPAEANLKTLYARRWHAQGQEAFHELRLIKENNWAIPLEEDSELNTHHIDRFDPERFQPENARMPCAIEFKDYLYDPKRERAMVRVMVVEEPLMQDFWIDIARVEQSWHIRPAWGCRMVPTRGVQQALDQVYAAATASTQG